VRFDAFRVLVRELPDEDEAFAAAARIRQLDQRLEWTRELPTFAILKKLKQLFENDIGGDHASERRMYLNSSQTTVIRFEQAACN
jgi:hypothetical protein